ncbi:adenylate/guanylate cyclase domain-containing protein, partial [bacterium]|nr:adenylate/guanylate cyclase domain-containing protein [bacterium]
YIYLIIPIVFCLILVDFVESYTLIDPDLLRQETNKCISSLKSGKTFKVREDISQKTKLPNIFSLKILSFGNTNKNFRFRLTSGRNSSLRKNYPYLYLLTDIRIFLLITFLWMFPIYRYNFSKKYNAFDKIQSRIVNLPIFLFIFVWIITIYMLCIKLFFYEVVFKVLPLRVILLYALTSAIFGCFLSFFYITLLLRYINNNIALPYFKKNKPYSLKKGIPITLTCRITLMIISLGVVPTLLGIFIPLSFNENLIRGNYNSLYILQNINLLIPLLFMIIIGAYFFIAQVITIISFRSGIQKPINGLIGRMKLVSQNQLDCKMPVLYTDEIGQLNGHLNTMLDSLIEQKNIKAKFGKFVSEEIANKIIETEKANLISEVINATVLFSDIRNFTPFSEKLNPTELVEFLNLYFSYMVKPIHANLGLINKFIGDAIMVIFSPNFGVENHATSAVRAAIEMDEALKKFNALKNYPKVNHGIGIHTGNLIAGNIGTPSRMEYTVIGDNVNIASRIESQTKILKTNILISKDVRENITESSFPDHHFVMCDPVNMKGKSEPILLYKVEKIS